MRKPKVIYDTGFKRADRTLRYEDLEREYHRMAKAADRRLRNLEKLSEEEHFKSVLDWSYSNAIRYIQENISPDGMRFDVKVKGLGTRTIQARINAIENFMLSPTSTKKGIKDIYMRRVETFNKEFGSNYTWEEFAIATEKDKWDDLKARLGSNIFANVIGKVKKSEKEIETILQKAKDENIKSKDLHNMLKNASGLSDVELNILKAKGIDLKEFIF